MGCIYRQQRFPGFGLEGEAARMMWIGCDYVLPALVVGHLVVLVVAVAHTSREPGYWENRQGEGFAAEPHGGEEIRLPRRRRSSKPRHRVAAGRGGELAASSALDVLAGCSVAVARRGPLDFERGRRVDRHVQTGA